MAHSGCRIRELCEFGEYWKHYDSMHVYPFTYAIYTPLGWGLRHAVAYEDSYRNGECILTSQKVETLLTAYDMTDRSFGRTCASIPHLALFQCSIRSAAAD